MPTALHDPFMNCTCIIGVRVGAGALDRSYEVAPRCLKMTFVSQFLRNGLCRLANRIARDRDFKNIITSVSGHPSSYVRGWEQKRMCVKSVDRPLLD